MRKINLPFLIGNEFSKALEVFATNKIILGICSITSLIGFAMTVYLSIKTKSIDKRIKELKMVQEFNRKRKSYVSSLKSYQISINEDRVDICKIRTNLLNDINIIYQIYKPMFRALQKITFWRIRKQLEKEKEIDANLVYILLSKIIAYMSEKKED